MNEWTECEPLGPTDAGDVGGDAQISDAFMRRWSKPAPGGFWAVVDVTAYVEKNDESTSMQRIIDLLVCADPSDPWGTELWSDVYEWDYVPRAEMTSEGARKACADYVFDCYWSGIADGINDEWTLTQPSIGN